MFPLSLLMRAGVCAAVLAASSRALAAQCGLDNNIGTNLGLGDDGLSPPQAIGFSFPFAGSSYDTVYVSANGFLYLFSTSGSIPAPTDPRCCDATVTALLASPNPVVCALWQDLNPSVGGTVNFNAVAGKALISWVNVPEYGVSGANTMQITLRADGAIDIYLDGTCANVSHSALTGWTPGNGASDPGNTNFASLPVITSSATVYDLFPPGHLDIGGRSLQALPASASTWVVVSPAGCAGVEKYGRGCPRPCTFYELFGPAGTDLSGLALRFAAGGNGSYSVTTCPANCFDSGFANNLNLADDSLAVGLNLGFTFTYCGGATNTIDVCSNGFVWLVSGSGASASYIPTGYEFLARPARLAPIWMDLDPSAGGAVYFDTRPGSAVVTWDRVPAFGVAGSSNTIQLQLFSNGDFIVAWPSVRNNATSVGDAIVGFTQGNGVSDPRPIDVSGVPFTTGSGIRLDLGARAGARPLLGTTFVMEARSVRPGTLQAAMSLGIGNPNLDLGFLGLSGCTWLCTLELAVPFVPSSPVATFALTIPNATSLIGQSLNAQALMVDLSLGGTLPVYLSNGLRITVGL